MEEYKRIEARRRAKEYYYKNREKQLKKRAEYREKNKDKISLREALKRISDPETKFKLKSVACL